MKIDFGLPHQIPKLKALWQAAFGDDEAFIDGFFDTAYAPARCRCVTVGDAVAAALYWFDVTCEGQRMAYIYAVATAPEHRGKGLCRALMADTHAHLALRSYKGVLLVPEGDALRRMYAGFGYESCTTIREFVCAAGDTPAPMHRIDREEFARRRQSLAPAGTVLQEEENLRYLERQAAFYTGMGFLAAVHQEGEAVFCPEILGNPDMAPQLLRSLGASCGTFRCPGTGEDFAMFLPLCETALRPTHFAFAFD